MKKSKTTIIQFKTFESNEDPVNFVKLRTRRPHLVHQMMINCEHLHYNCELIQSKNLHTPLKSLKFINLLLILFNETNLESSMILQNISMRLKSLSFLQELWFQFYSSNWISLEGAKHLAGALAQMKLLKKFTLCFDSCHWVNDQSLHLIFQSLKKNKNIQSLDLDLCNCTNITKKSFKLLGSVFKRSLKSLKESWLRLWGLDFTKGYPLEFLTSGLAFLKDLQKLRIDFTNVKVPPGIDFSSFMSSIGHLTSLKRLSLDFFSLTISVTALKDLAKSFSLVRLHTLSLSFRWSSTFAEPEMEVLIECLQSLGPSLKNLTLEFSYSQTVNDQALEKLSACLRTLTNLSEIALLCDNCPYIGEPGIASVTYGLVSLPNLYTVNLRFSGCRPVKINYKEILKTNKNIIKLTFGYEVNKS